jgi:glutamine amidotransferase
MKNKLVVIDIDMGNAGSVVNMIRKVGGNPLLTRDKFKIADANKLILPGDGAFDTGMLHLEKFDLLDLLVDKVIKKKTLFLGVCVGLQLLTKKSEEGKKAGLGWIEAETIRFKFLNKNLRVPHMGWNTVDTNRQSKLFKNMPKNSRFYFVHSYHLVCHDNKDIVTTTNYGYDFVSSVEKDNIFGVQFHPEKSHKYGMQLYTNFLRL